MATNPEANENAVAQKENERSRILAERAQGKNRSPVIAEAEKAEERRLNSIQEANAKKSNIEKQNKGKKDKEGGDLSWGTFALMLGAAIFVDILTILINLIPGVGGLISDFTIQPCVIMGFWIWCKVKGIPLLKEKRAIWTPVFLVIGFIPILSALPEWTMQVIMLKITTTAEKELKQISGK